MSKMNAIQAVNAALAQALEEDPKVLVFGEDIADREGGGVTGTCKGLSTRFGDRVRSTPISEQAIVGAAIGAALGGYKPVCEIMLMNFTAVAMDMIFNHAAKLRFMSGGQSEVPIVIRTLTGAGWQTAGQHSDQLEGWFAHAAGIKVVSPSEPAEYKGLLLAAIQDPDPVMFIENSQTLFVPGEVADDQGPIPLGKARTIQEGSDLTIVTWGSMVLRSRAALAPLAEAGISVELIDLRTVNPWDKAAVLTSAAKTNRVLVVHEAVRNFGPGAEIAASVNEELFGQLKAPVRRLGAPQCAVPFAKVLEDAFMVSPDQIVAAAKGLCN
ncbi:MAG: transketolase C-terminal domain-containing protein [Novosphingobium sp.]